MSTTKYLFIDRDGTLIIEPEDKQIDRLDKLALVEGVIPALLRLQSLGYRLVMVSNQDGLGTPSFPQADFERVHKAMLQIFSSQGITFDDILICPHFDHQGCSCRKPNIGLLLPYLQKGFAKENSFVIGDRETDLKLATHLGIEGIRIGPDRGWKAITRFIESRPRVGSIHRKTKETDVQIQVDLDDPQLLSIHTGLAYFDHMLEQLGKHGGFGLRVQVNGDLQVDEHHTVEDTALGLGEALRQAIGDKVGIARYGFALPMDEAAAQALLDLSGRALFQFEGRFSREYVGELPTELVPHFFRSLSDALGATLHLKVSGENAHHMVESLFKVTGRALRQAVQRGTGNSGLPSTKGVL